MQRRNGQANSGGDVFDEYIYTSILEYALEGWSPEKFARQTAAGSKPTSKDKKARRFLASCCLVSKEWCTLSRRLLYRSLWIGDVYKNEGLDDSPDLAMLVRYLSLKTDVGMSSAARIMRLPSLTRLQVLSVREDVPRAPLHLSSSMQPFPAPTLTHLLYQGGNTHLLGHLLTLLPHLQSLHVGRFNYSSSRLQSPPDTTITCRLREVVFQSVYHYNKDHFEWLFGTSKSSIQYLTVANYGSLLYDLADYFHNARYVQLTVKNNLFEVPEDPEQYQLSFLLQRFKHLERLTLHVGHDWTGPWPDAKYSAVQEELPNVAISYEKGKYDFLDCKIKE